MLHIADEQEKADKGQKQSVVDIFKQLPVHNRHDRRDNHQHDREFDHPQHAQQADDKQHQINRQFFAVRFVRILRRNVQRLVFQRENRNKQHHQRDDRQRQHPQDKLPERDRKGRVEVKVLGVADRGHHTAEVGGDCLQNDDRNHHFFQVSHRQDHHRERYKGDQCDVVCDQHAGEKAERDQQQA